MNEVENKKQTPESPARPENKKIYCRPHPYARFTPKLKEVTKLLQKSFPKLFTRKPEPKYALKIGIYNDLISWASEHNITEAELGKALGFWCCGWRYRKALETGKRYDLNFNETPFYKEEMASETTTVPSLEASSKRKKLHTQKIGQKYILAGKIRKSHLRKQWN